MKQLLLILSAVITIFNLPNAALAVAPNFVFGTDTVYDSANNRTWTRDAKTPGPAACSPGVEKDWGIATGTYINCINSNNYLGYSDWRVPTIDELRIFPDNALHYDDLNALGFANVQVLVYWSSSTYADNPSSAWTVYMRNGYVGYNNKSTYSNYVWPVRGGQSGSLGSLALSISKNGTGSGAVTSSTGGINCGSTCSASVASGTTVTLTAAPSSDSTFAGWSGACSGTATTCSVSMTAAQSVGAAFNLAPGVTNGTCGTANATTVTAAPSTNLCSTGNTASTVTASGTGWSWTCSGTGTASPASCTATRSTSSSTTIPITGRVTLRPQVLMGGFDPILLDMADTTFKLIAVVRPGAVAIQNVQVANNGGGFSTTMNYAGTYSNGDQRYEDTYSFPRGAFPTNTILGDLFGSAGSQFRMTVIDASQLTHSFPSLESGNNSQLTTVKASPATAVSSQPGIVRGKPQILAAGFDPQLIDLGDTSFDLLAIVRQGSVPIQNVSLTQNQSGFAVAMTLAETLPNGDQKYKSTYTFQRGAFGNNLFGDLFGTNPGQFRFTVTDQSQQTHSFPELRWGNNPAL